jgi:hypothetical protein
MTRAIEFYTRFKQASEEKWKSVCLQPNIWGFQIQAGTRWNPGLSEEECVQYEVEVGFRFPSEVREFLQQMNGTNLLALDIRGSSGEEHRSGPAFYSFPRDLLLVTNRIGSAWTNPTQLRHTLSEEGFQLGEQAKLLPIYAHRYVVCSSEMESCPVLSIWDSTDAIVYGQSLPEYLEREVFGE